MTMQTIDKKSYDADDLTLPNSAWISLQAQFKSIALLQKSTPRKYEKILKCGIDPNGILKAWYQHEIT